MRGIRLTFAVSALLIGACAATPATAPTPASVLVLPTTAPSLAGVIAGPQRSDANRARDRYRHPLETLEFFGIEHDMTVVEIWPGAGGWYTEILAPYLRAYGQYVAAGFVANSKAPAYQQQAITSFKAKLDAAPQIYDRAVITEIGPNRWSPVPPESADMVLTFRNVHNWVSGGYQREMFAAFFRSLKPGGVLGVVEHRAEPDWTLSEMKASGYMTQDYVIQIAEEAGFKFVAWEEINANPKDLKNYPEGVWTLPPTLRLGDKDREKYLAIGESDRMTLKFVKP